MTQIDPRTTKPTDTTRTPDVGEPPRKQEPPFNWRVSVGMAIGLVVLFGVLFGLRALDIFPPKPAEDPQIAAARATLVAVPTQQAVAAIQPTTASTQAAAPATLGPIVLSTPAQTNVALAGVTPPPVQTSAPASGRTQQPMSAQAPAAAGAQFETAPTPVASTAPDQANPGVTTPIDPTPAQATPAGESTPSAQPTPSAINLPANLANAILQGYENYWSVRVNALNNPYDSTIDLESAMAGTELETARQTVAHLRDTGETGVSDVHHQIWITSASPQQAVVVDRYTSHGQRVMVNPTTQAPLPGDPVLEDESYADRFLLQNMDGVWKVVEEEPE